MGYKLLGKLVWKGGRLFLRRKYPGAPRKMAIAGVGGAAMAAGAVGVFMLARRASKAV